MSKWIRKKVIDGHTYLSPIITVDEVNGIKVYTKHYREFKEAIHKETLKRFFTNEDKL